MYKRPILILLAIAAIAFLLYRSNLLKKVDAAFALEEDHIEVISRGGTLHDCTIKMTGEYGASIDRLVQGRRHFVPIYDLKQWNGMVLLSMKSLPSKVKMTLRCKEGGDSDTVLNRYAAE